MAADKEIIIAVVGGTLVILMLVGAVIGLVYLCSKRFRQGVKWAEAQQNSHLAVAKIRVRRQLESQLNNSSNTLYDIPTLQAVLKILEDDKGAKPEASP